MTRDDAEAGLLLLMKRFDRIGFGRRGVLDAEDQVVAWRGGLAEGDARQVSEITWNWLQKAHATAVAEPLHYTRPEDVQALAVHLLARWGAPGLVPELDALVAAGAFLNEDGVVAPALAQALDEARTPIDR